jgi:hypothetical protein
MANKNQKRKSKHRGNAAGMVEARGRTGRKPTQEEKSGGGRKQQDSKSARVNRYDQPPSWRSAAVRAVLAAGVFFGLLYLFLKRPPAASAMIAMLMIVLYTPLGYYTDLWIYRRRQKKKAEAGGQ